MVRPPMTTLSVPTSPDAELPSPYEIFHCWLVFLKVEDLAALKTLWFCWLDLASSVEKIWKR